MELEGRVTSIALYGIFVDIGVGRDGLVHISEMSDTRIESPSDLVKIGDTVKVRVKSVEPDGRRISLTMRTKERGAEPRGSRGKKKPEVDYEKLAALRVGDNIEGTVTGIAPFGVFVDIGVGKDGLVHVSELAEGRVEKAEDVVQVGQTYTFKVLEVDAAGARISLSLRRAQRGQKLQQLEKGQILEGTISGLAPFGAFVDIGVGRDGLVHISELSNTHVERVEDVVNGWRQSAGTGA
jgi:Ribosomal protein S1